MKTKKILPCFFLGVLTPCWLLAQEVPIEIVPTPMMFNSKELQEGKDLIKKLLPQEELNTSLPVLSEKAGLPDASERGQLSVHSENPTVFSSVSTVSAALLPGQNQSLPAVIPISEELEESSSEELGELLTQAFEPEGRSKSKASRVLRKIASCLANVSEYLTQATHAREAGNLESAILWEKAAQQSEAAGEQWKKVIYESISLAIKKLEHLEKNILLYQENLANEFIKQQLEQKESVAFWQKVAEQAGISLENDQVMIIPEESVSSFKWKLPSGVIRAPQETRFEKAANFLTSSAHYLAAAAKCLKKAGDTTTLEKQQFAAEGDYEDRFLEVAALWKLSAQQFENAAEYYAQSAQEYLLNSKSEDGRQWAQVGDSFKKSAKSLSQAIKYRDQASPDQTEGRSQLAFYWRQAAEKLQSAAEYYKKHAQLLVTEDREKSKRDHMRYTELFETEIAADTYQAISKYWHHAAEAFNAKDQESAELWTRAAEKMQVYADYEQATVEKRALEKIPMANYSTADSSLRCVANHLADAAEYSEQAFQVQDSLETAILFRRAKEQSEAASERAKESAQAHQLENRKKGNELGTAARTLWNSARCFAEAVECSSIIAQCFVRAAEQWNKSSDAYKIGNTQEGYYLEKSAEYMGVTANQLNAASEYTQRASQYQTSGKLEQAVLLTQAAEKSTMAAEYRSNGAHAYALGNEEEARSWREKVRPIEDAIYELASSLRSLN